MTRRIAIRTKTSVRFYDINSSERPITIIGQRLYRTDEKYMLANATRPEEFCMYDLDSTYPYSVDPCAPDETMAYLDIIKASGKKIKRISSWPKWLNWNTMVYALLGAVVVYYIVTRLLGGGA